MALDRAGNLAAATSTGGLTNKHRGRVGDTPIIGAGTYADNDCCAVSGTGHGEYFIREVVAYDICALMAYTQLTLSQRRAEVIHEKLAAAGGEGGVIAIDRGRQHRHGLQQHRHVPRRARRRGLREIAMYGEHQV